MSGDRPVVIETIRALGRIGDPAALAPLVTLVHAAETEAHVRLEAVSALAGFHAANALPGMLDTLLDLTRLESGASPLVRNEVGVSSLMRET